MTPRTAVRSEHWLELKNIEVWQNDRVLVKGLSLDLMLGEPTTVLGPNGSGKSTLVKLIERRLHPVVKPNSHLRLFGTDRIHLQNLRQRIGILNTELDERIPRRCSVGEVVLSGCFGSTRLGRGQEPTDQQYKQTKELLERFELQSLEHRQYYQLSDGQKRRLLLARALIHQPEVLVLDEPARALDLRACHQLMAMIRELCQDGVTVMQVTHRVDTIVPEMQKTVLLKDGRVYDQGSPHDLLTSANLSKLFGTDLTIVEANGFRQVVPGASEH
ncbi:MAG: ABC transporter ATP-binding protein [Synechococcus sp.]